MIYSLRPPEKDDPMPNQLAGNSQVLSKRFGVSPKAVRDVWNRRTWAHATKDQPPITPADLELLELSIDSEKSTPVNIKPRHENNMCRTGISVRSPAGRPVGSKDSKPRRRRSVKGGSPYTDSLTHSGSGSGSVHRCEMNVLFLCPASS